MVAVGDYVRNDELKLDGIVQDLMKCTAAHDCGKRILTLDEADSFTQFYYHEDGFVSIVTPLHNTKWTLNSNIAVGDYVRSNFFSVEGEVRDIKPCDMPTCKANCLTLMPEDAPARAYYHMLPFKIIPRP